MEFLAFDVPAGLAGSAALVGASWMGALIAANVPRCVTPIQDRALRESFWSASITDKADEKTTVALEVAHRF